MRELDAKSRRDLFRGSLDVMVLAVLADGRQYGYSIQKRLRAASGQAVQAGTLYPLLHRLETQGLIAATWEEGTGRPRKWYSLTSAGEKKFRGAVADWQAMFARMQSLVLPALRHVTNHPQTPPTTR